MEPNTSNQETPEETWDKASKNVYFKHGLSVPDMASRLILKEYLELRKCIEQAAPVKSLQECKDEVARSYNYSSTKCYADWNSMVSYLKTERWIIDGRLDQAAELYASQFRNKVVITDEEIDTYIINRKKMKWATEDESSFEEGVKWARSKYEGK